MYCARECSGFRHDVRSNILDVLWTASLSLHIYIYIFGVRMGMFGVSSGDGLDMLGWTYRSTSYGVTFLSADAIHLVASFLPRTIKFESVSRIYWFHRVVLKLTCSCRSKNMSNERMKGHTHVCIHICIYR